MSHKISLLFACGHGEAEVAAVVGHCIKTLRRVFSKEWNERKIARLKVRGEQLYRLNAAAQAGNVTAEKALAGMIQAEATRAVSDRLTHTPSAARPARLGKKEQQQADAMGITGLYAPPVPGAALN